MTRYIYEAEFAPDEDGYVVTVPDLPGYITEGDDITEAVCMADDALKTFVAVMLKNGDKIPSPTFGHEAHGDGMVIAISFETDASYIVDEVSPSHAADMIGVSRSRVSHLIRDGILETRKDGKETMVSVKSINAYKKSPRKAGRPKNKAVTG